MKTLSSSTTKEHLSTSSTKLEHPETPSIRLASLLRTQLSPFLHEILKLGFERVKMIAGRSPQRSFAGSRSETRLGQNKYSRVKKNKSLSFLKEMEGKVGQNERGCKRDPVEKKIKRLQKLRTNICKQKNQKLKIVQSIPQQEETTKMDIIMSEINKIKQEIQEVKTVNKLITQKLQPGTPQTYHCYSSSCPSPHNILPPKSYCTQVLDGRKWVKPMTEVKRVNRPSSVMIRPKVTFNLISREDHLRREKAKSVQIEKRGISGWVGKELVVQDERKRYIY